VRREGPKPPYQALTITAAKKKRKGVLAATPGSEDGELPGDDDDQHGDTVAVYNHLPQGMRDRCFSDQHPSSSRDG